MATTQAHWVGNYDPALVARMTRPVYHEMVTQAYAIQGETGSSRHTKRTMVRRGVGPGHWLAAEYDFLCSLGIMREVGMLPGHRKTLAMHYELTPVDEVARAAAEWSRRVPRKKSKRRTSKREMLRMPTRDAGDAVVWIRTRKGIDGLCDLLTALLPAQALWDCIPDEDLAILADDLANLEDAVQTAWETLSERVVDDAERERIQKLRNTTGRTPEEARSFRAMADKLNAKRIIQD